ncbi:MraY family glycosyltransferase [Frateuria terrea]|uniref:UDP-N-acetylmuramyl pentapeptide phosphotransferase/UDP-N-acetylglucosamine-1-phosphate transferase n=1 Tax=Frateuria terrea TaxID=529704 RepID=A0A1H6TR35_9GAMM|nr:glycosyltransferase family 4 protein [Frateuria terrea]SEI82539.1 UDP-N-acetylmuramyl pentapeptide phosphotransferase/UDP-N-acetylglucosamine-1-phosphate transferase [Frateuria terrea]SFP40757.1 UDP-N-acetylmuramyl pentapeptide phosphotransferase/UDP-N-acetylglucosamine-1-phosphate transferase [Frateuria terrea]
MPQLQGLEHDPSDPRRRQRVTRVELAIVLGWSLVALAIAALAVRGAIAYARRRGMLDQPGQRRSHTLPTPRGGGIGIVLACLVVLPCILCSLAGPWDAPTIANLELALVLVAAIGWWDDHRPLRQWPRLGVQLLATAFVGGALLADAGLAWGWLPLLVLAGGWSINLHNFMDGIDALLAQQGIFVAAGLGCLAASAGQPALAGAGFATAAACLGFWLYNRPPARIFMGDVGSGSVGLLLFALSAMLWRIEPALVWPALILGSSFVADASLTLLNRFLRGRRWYAPHREHLYQWLVRSGGTHARAAAWYLGWNLLVAAPAAVAASQYPAMALPACAAVYTVAGATWIVSKRRCMRRASMKDRHVAT